MDVCVYICKKHIYKLKTFPSNIFEHKLVLIVQWDTFRQTDRQTDTHTHTHKPLCWIDHFLRKTPRPHDRNTGFKMED